MGKVVDYDDLKAAFTKDTDGNPDAIASNCESCRSGFVESDPFLPTCQW